MLVNKKGNKMKIINTEMSNDCGSIGVTVAVTVQNKDGKQVRVHVLTFDGLYRKNLDYPLYSDGYTELEESDFDDYEGDIEKIVKEAEKYIRNAYRVEGIQAHLDYVFKIFGDKVTLSVLNRQFISPDKTPNKIKYHDIASFETLERAKAFIVDRLEHDQKGWN